MTLATFPDDALTVHGLLSAVRSPIGAFGESFSDERGEGSSLNGSSATIGVR